MTMEEAIKILNDHAYKKMKVFDEDLEKAEMLGIEALKRLHVLRLISTNEANHLLPGETEE